MLILVILIYIIIGLVQGVSLIKKRYWRELIISTVFLGIAFILSVLYILDFNIPSPAKGMQYIIEDVLHLRYPQ